MRLVIIGGSDAGISAGLAARELAPETEVTLLVADRAYYPGATPIRIRLTGDTETGQLLDAQLVGSLGAEIAKRVGVLATGIHHGSTVEQVSDLDLSYTPPMGSPWDALQHATQAWTRATCRPLVS